MSDLTLSGLILADNEERSTSESELDVSGILHKAFGSALAQSLKIILERPWELLFEGSCLFCPLDVYYVTFCSDSKEKKKRGLNCFLGCDELQLHVVNKEKNGN